MDTNQQRGISLADTVRFLILLLRKWAARGEFGEVKITVMGGQIATVQESTSYRGRLPGGHDDTAKKAAEAVIQAMK